MYELIAGPYVAPKCRRGDWIEDERDGLVEVGGWTDAPIPWPRRKKTGRAALILTGDLVRAVRIESAAAIRMNWGVSATTVWAWRKALGVDPLTDGTRQLMKEVTGVPPAAAARGRLASKTPEARARLSVSKQGKPAHPTTAAALLAAARRPKPEGWGRRANAWMMAAKGKSKT